MAEAGARVEGEGVEPDRPVFTTRSGEPLDAANVRRDFQAIVKKAGLKPEWTPRELRHSFVSLLSDRGIPLEEIALLVGHSSQADHRGGLPEAAPARDHQTGPKPWTRSSLTIRREPIGDAVT